jgi:hypothetical protein
MKFFNAVMLSKSDFRVCGMRTRREEDKPLSRGGIRMTERPP